MLQWLKKREIREIATLKEEVEALKRRVSAQEVEIFCLKGLPAFLFDDPDLLWNAIWNDMQENSVVGYAVSSTLALSLLKKAGYQA